jgi:DinB superfamily
MPTVTEPFTTLNRERAEFLAVFENLPDAFLEQKGVVGEWSIKNVLAHVNDWESIVTRFIPERLATGNKPEILALISADEDAWNVQQVDEHERLTVQEQLAAFAQTRQKLLQLLREIGQETLNRPHPWKGWEDTLAAYILQEVGAHEREHYEAIRAAITKL